MITLIYSEQSKLASLSLKKLLAKEHPDLNEYNFVSFDMGNNSIEDLVLECETHSLCFDTKVVVAENCFFLDKKSETKKKKKEETTDKLLEYVKHPDPSTDLYLLLYSGTLNKANPIIQEISTNHRIQEIANLTEAQWLQTIENYFTKKGYKIDSYAVNEIYKRTNGDYCAYSNECQKLLAYKLEEKEVTHADVITLLAPKIEEDSFRMSNCLTSGDVSNAIKIYKDLKIHGNDEMSLIGMLATQFIFYDKVKYLSSQGFNVDQIASELKQPNSKRVYVTVNNLRRISSKSISQILEQLYDAENSILSGIVSQEFAFSRFLAIFSL